MALATASCINRSGLQARVAVRTPTQLLGVLLRRTYHPNFLLFVCIAVGPRTGMMQPVCLERQRPSTKKGSASRSAKAVSRRALVGYCSAPAAGRVGGRLEDTQLALAEKFMEHFEVGWEEDGVGGQDHGIFPVVHVVTLTHSALLEAVFLV